LVGLATQAPVLIGRVPFPSGMILSFPPWDAVRGELEPMSHAELGDAATQFYPWRLFAREEIRRGALPAWNPHLLLGTPFVANSTSAVFYPPNALTWILSAPLGWALGFPLRTLLGFFFTALLARELGASRSGALAAGLIFSLCGFQVGWQVWPQTDAAVWLPLILLAVWRLWHRPGPGAVALAGVAFAMPVLAGHPEVAFYVTGAGVAFWLFLLLRDGRPDRRRALAAAARLAAGAALAVGLAAAQMLPTLEWVGQIQRSTGHSWTSPLRPLQLQAFVSRDARASRTAIGVPVPEGAAYAGMLTLVAAPLAFGLRRRRRETVFFLALAAAAAGVVYGIWPLFQLSAHIPVFRSFPNNRLLLLVELCLAVLAAFGLTAVQEEGPRDGRKVTLALLPSAFLLAAVSGRALLLRGPVWGGPRGLVSSWLLWALAAALVAAAAVARRGRWRTGAAFPLAALVLLGVDLGTFAYGHVPFVAPSRVFPSAPVYDYLGALAAGAERRGQPFRATVVDNAAPPNSEMVYGLSNASGYEFALRRTYELLAPFPDALPRAGLVSGMSSDRIVAAGDRRLDLFNVRYLVSSNLNAGTPNLAAHPERFRQVWSQGAIQVFENLHALPRAFLVPLRAARVDPDPESALARLRDPGFDPAAAVLLAEPPADPGAGTPAPLSRVLAVRDRAGDVRVRAVVAEPSVLVVSQSFYPGWKARVDGRPRPVLRADHALQAVVLAPGTHEIELTFESPALRAGLILSALSLLVLAVLSARAILAGSRSQS
jgi:hypothetical protein